jgi:hypothetical protein
VSYKAGGGGRSLFGQPFTSAQEYSIYMNRVPSTEHSQASGRVLRTADITQHVYVHGTYTVRPQDVHA